MHSIIMAVLGLATLVCLGSLAYAYFIDFYPTANGTKE